MKYDVLNYVGNDVTLEKLLKTADWPDQLKENIDVVARYKDKSFENLTLGQMKELFVARLAVEREWVKRYPLNKNHRSDTLFKEYLLLKILESSSSSPSDLFSLTDIYSCFLFVLKILNNIISKEYYDMNYILDNRYNFAILHGYPFYTDGLPTDKQLQSNTLINYINSFSDIQSKSKTLQNLKDHYSATLQLTQINHSCFPLNKFNSLFAICRDKLLLEVLLSSTNDGGTLFIDSDVYELFTEILDLSGGIVNENILFFH